MARSHTTGCNGAAALPVDFEDFVVVLEAVDDAVDVSVGGSHAAKGGSVGQTQFSGQSVRGPLPCGKNLTARRGAGAC